MNPILERARRVASRGVIAALVTGAPVGCFAYAFSSDAKDVLSSIGVAVVISVGIAVQQRTRAGLVYGCLVGIPTGILMAVVAGAIRQQAVGWLIPPVVGLAIGLIEGAAPEAGHPATSTVKRSLLIGFVLGLGILPAHGPLGWLAAVALGVLVAFYSILLSPKPSGWGLRLSKPPTGLMIYALVFFGLTLGVIYTEVKPHRGGSAVRDTLLITAITAAVNPIAALLAGRWLSAWSRPRLEIYRDLLRYLRIMSIPITAFSAGYVVLILVFSGLYGTLYRLQPESAFSGVPDGSVVRGMDWLFFSFFNATAQDYNDIRPVSDSAKVLVGLQLLFGVGWAVVVFAAVMAYIQPRMEEVTRRLKQVRKT